MGGDTRTPLFELTDFGFLERAPLYENVFEVERYRWKYAAYLDLLARNRFNYDIIYASTSGLHDMIAPYVTQGTGDKMYFGDTAMFPYESFAGGWDGLATFAGERSRFILEELASMQQQSVFDSGGSQ